MISEDMDVVSTHMNPQNAICRWYQAGRQKRTIVEVLHEMGQDGVKKKESVDNLQISGLCHLINFSGEKESREI